MKMHDGEKHIDESLVERLVRAQFPRFAGLPVRAFRSTGTVNAVFRLGDEWCVRLPRLARWAPALERETRWLPELGPLLPLGVPEVAAVAEPSAEFGWTWAIYRWLEGSPYDDAMATDQERAAADLAGFVHALRVPAVTADVPRAGRRPLRELDEVTRQAIAAIGPGAEAALAAWLAALEAPVWDGAPTWIHADLLRPNLLVSGGRLAAVLDFGSVGAGDPAADVVPAWSVFGPAGRTAYRRALGVDEGTWQRARGYALHQAALIIPYYAATNPAFAAQARRTVAEVVGDVRNQ
jgi:aminoglycoside phosphotransferase (APT) family kinase protein